MMDNGFPFTTEPNALMEIIPPSTMIKNVVKGITGQSSISANMSEGGLTNTPWRKQGVRYATNEIYFDIIEELDCVVEPYVIFYIYIYINFNFNLFIEME